MLKRLLLCFLFVTMNSLVFAEMGDDTLPRDDSSGTLSSLPQFDRGRFYVSMPMGFYARNVKENSIIGAELLSNNTNSMPYTWSHGHYGWTMGLGAGWSFLDNYSLELGTFWSSKQQVKVTDGTGGSAGSFCLNQSCFAANSTVSMQSWWTYTALRAQFPLDENWYAHARFGFSFTRNQYHSYLTAGSEHKTTEANISGHKNGHVNVWSPLLGLGLDYYVSPKMWVSMTYQVMLGPHLADDPYFSSSSYSVNGTYVPLWQMVLMSVNVRL